MILGCKEIAHPSHPRHKLKFEYTDVPFSCNGCKEAGIGVRYRCETCDFDLHKICALAPVAITHPFYKKCEFGLCTRPPGAMIRVCDACRKVVFGLVYHCTECGFDLHPCCANLPNCLEDGKRNYFYLFLKISNPCHRCGGKGLGWSYRSECKNYSLHVSCVKELLLESWQHVYDLKVADKPRKVIREIQSTRIPSLLMGTTQNHHRRPGKVGKVERCCQIARGAIQIIISAVLGDPTAMIAAVVGGFISK